MPTRMCATCRRKGDPATMLRIASGGGDLAIGRGPGRGLHVCKLPECIRGLAQRGRLSRGLRRDVAADELAALIARLLEQVA